MTYLMTWLVPTIGPVREHLLAIIDRLAAEHNAPRFQPHVTLVATYDLDEATAAKAISSIAADTRPVDVTFAAIGHEQAYFRSLYLLPEPSSELTTLHEATQREWELDSGRPFAPHLSLLYSDIPEKQKPSILETISIPLPVTVRFDAIELWSRKVPEVYGWYRIARVPFSGL